MVAALDDPALPQDQDLVGVHDGRQPMRDHEGSAVATDAPECFLDRRLGGTIQGRRRLVEDQEPGIRQKRPGYTHPLSFSPRKLQAPLAHPDREAPRRRLDEGSKFRRLGGGLDLRLRRVWPGEGDVGAQGVVKQGDILWDQGHGAPQIRAGKIPDPFKSTLYSNIKRMQELDIR